MQYTVSSIYVDEMTIGHFSKNSLLDIILFLKTSTSADIHVHVTTIVQYTVFHAIYCLFYIYVDEMTIGHFSKNSLLDIILFLKTSTSADIHVHVTTIVQYTVLCAFLS